jgi:hypothetical protein
VPPETEPLAPKDYNEAGISHQSGLGSGDFRPAEETAKSRNGS